MRVTVGAVGSLGRGPVARAVREYEERASRYFDLRTVEVEAGGGQGADESRLLEGRRLTSRLSDDVEWMALTRSGKGISSRGLARYLGELGTYGRGGVAFLVGGPHGLSEEVLDRARRRLSLSPMTFPHAVARLVLTEQIYRAGTIIRGEPYHKER